MIDCQSSLSCVLDEVCITMMTNKAAFKTEGGDELVFVIRVRSSYKGLVAFLAV